MKALIRSVAGRSLALSGMMRKRLESTGVIVAYHRVNDESAGDALTRSPADYEAFGRFYRDHFDVVPLSRFVARLAAGESVGGMLVITHDDGYLDNYEHAAPILSKLGLPATFFVSTRFIESDIVPWWDADEGKRFSWMSWEQVRELDRAGFEIGAHTQTHVDLGRVDADEARRELLDSKIDLERELTHPVELFAYPYGGAEHMCESNLALVRDTGFACSMSCHGGVVPDGTDVFRMARVPISMWYPTPSHLAFDLGTGRG
jgi:peptidoglycan/xylan/chitin deacetylase (PgdA/CDA1 family)